MADEKKRRAEDVVRKFVDLGDYYAEEVVAVNADGSPIGGGGEAQTDALTDEELRAAPVEVDTGLVQPLTDALLRADPVDVETGLVQPLTNTELRAAPVEVTGDFASDGLTDDELRATPIQVDLINGAGRLLGVVTLDAATLAALESISAVGPLTDAQLRASAVPVVLDAAALAALETIELGATTLAALETINTTGVTAEDGPTTSGDPGMPVLVMRHDADSTSVSQDGDYSLLHVDANGRLKVIAAASYLEDTAAIDGDRGMFVLAMRHDAESATVTADADYTALHTDNVGRLKVSPTGVFVEDSAHSDGDKGHFVLAVRHAAETAMADTDGDYSALQTNAQGRLKVHSITTPSGTGTPTDVANAVADGQVLAANSNRTGAIIFNDDTITTGATANIAVGFAASATRFSVKIPPQGMYEVPRDYVTLEIRRYSSAATGTLRVTETT